ncbi:hypothetical protein [Nocardia gipuzkoensis]|uniref:hypothetical protein n=1 Tax=Nocardia gipuzkoensis TaxID=2749991 RepID=UPI0015EE5005|nr:hypothetical protein [Nocardia gipuzkoensis]
MRSVLVVEHYKTIAFKPEFIELMRSAMEKTVADSQAATGLYRKQLQDQLKELDTKEANLVELAEDGAMPKARIKDAPDRDPTHAGEVGGRAGPGGREPECWWSKSLQAWSCCAIRTVRTWGPATRSGAG